MKINGYIIGPFVNLRYANLRGANLRYANLRYANLRGADLRDANLRDADLRGADLRGADLRDADLRGAELCGAELCDANLRGADLRDAELCGAELCDANLRGADLRDANLCDADLPNFQIPQDGSLIVWKALRNGHIAKLLIPDAAKRTATPIGRKCRAEFVEVLAVYDGFGIEVTESIPSNNDSRCTYKKGITVYPDKYNDDIRVECTNGIHFFLTKEEALKW